MGEVLLICGTSPAEHRGIRYNTGYNIAQNIILNLYIVIYNIINDVIYGKRSLAYATFLELDRHNSIKLDL